MDDSDDDYEYGKEGEGGDGEAGQIDVGQKRGASVGRACPGKRRRIVTVTQWSTSARANMVRELSDGVT